MRNLTIGLLAHVDAGKTTLGEALLHRAGAIRTLGRVDHGNSHLDVDALERARGITIFSKHATFDYADLHVSLLDTPGHVDFCAETERALQALDCAVLVVSAPAGVQGHTQTLWRLLERAGVPTFVFVNKTDIAHGDRASLIARLVRRLGPACLDFTPAPRPGGPVSTFAHASGIGVKARGNLETAPAPQSAAGSSENPGAPHSTCAFELAQPTLEAVACASEAAMEEFLERGALAPQTVRELVTARAVVPCLFGSALRLDGIDDLLACLAAYAPRPQRREQFAARVFKVTHDAQGNRLAWLKLTGGQLAVKDQLATGGGVRAQLPGAQPASVSQPQASTAAGFLGQGLEAGGPRFEKVNQIRVYQGAKFAAVDRVAAGEVCAVTGLTSVFPGDVLGCEPPAPKPLLAPVLTYAVLPGACDVPRVYAALRELAEEDPLLGVAWNEQLQEIRLQLMGPIQLEVVRQLLLDRHGFEVAFGPGGIAYRETIAAPVVGVGHFEPLRHYAEVHLLIEPLAPGSGLEFGSACSEDLLDRNWQRLFLTNAMERAHLGTLTGAPLTDVRVTLLAGATHPKHTQGGDCRQATYRAVRQGLMQARERGEAVLLEPWYDFRLEVPQELIGRAITDVQAMHGRFDTPLTCGDEAVLEGEAPVSTMQGYAVELAAYTRGRGRIFCALRGYEPCHNAGEVVAQAAYDPCADLAHTPDSVFCSHGAGYPVPWHEAAAAMHLASDPRGTAPWRPADAAFFAAGVR